MILQFIVIFIRFLHCYQFLAIFFNLNKIQFSPISKIQLSIIFDRKKFGIQFFLDIIRQYYAVPSGLSEEDSQAIRAALMEIIKYYIYKDLNIKEVCVIIAYIASIGHEHLILEIMELLLNQMNSKNCLDQLFLLMHEPQTAELCYALLTERKYGTRLHSTVIKVSEIEIYRRRQNLKD